MQHVPKVEGEAQVGTSAMVQPVVRIVEWWKRLQGPYGSHLHTAFGGGACKMGSLCYLWFLIMYLVLQFGLVPSVGPPGPQLKILQDDVLR